MNEKKFNTYSYPEKKPRKKSEKKLLREGKHAARGVQQRLTPEQLDYCYQISKDLEELEGTERKLLAENFLKEITAGGNVKILTCNKYVSHILEDVVKYVGASGVLALCQILGEDLRLICQDPSASHILQTLMVISLKLLQDQVKQESTTVESTSANHEEREPCTQEQREELTSFLNKVGRFVYNNLDEYVCNTYGSHVFRSVLEVCSGVKLDESVRSSCRTKTSHALQVDGAQSLNIPSILQDLLGDIALHLQKLPRLPDIIINKSGSAALQSAILILKGCGRKESSSFANHILKNGFPGIELQYSEAAEKFSSIFHFNTAVRLLEVIISCAKRKQMNKIYIQYFKGHIPELVKDKSGNFAVQKLLLSWKEKETFEDLFTEVCEGLPIALEMKHYGVIQALSETCCKLASNQGRCWKAIMQLLRCYKPHERHNAAAPCLLFLLHFDEYQEMQSMGELTYVSYHGTSILQQFLQFNKTKQIVQSLMNMSINHLQFMACHPCGSHVIDAFATSTFIKQKNKELFILKFKGTYVTLACSKHGSRSLEALWNVSSVKLKTDICQELANEELRVLGDKHGAIIYSKFKVIMFKRNDKLDWQQLVGMAAKKKRLLDELLDGVIEDQPKKKKQRKSITGS